VLEGLRFSAASCVWQLLGVSFQFSVFRFRFSLTALLALLALTALFKHLP
jgi:hypothetical protein